MSAAQSKKAIEDHNMSLNNARVDIHLSQFLSFARGRSVTVFPGPLNYKQDKTRLLFLWPGKTTIQRHLQNCGTKFDPRAMAWTFIQIPLILFSWEITVVKTCWTGFDVWYFGILVFRSRLYEMQKVPKKIAPNIWAYLMIHHTYLPSLWNIVQNYFLSWPLKMSTKDISYIILSNIKLKSRWNALKRLEHT